MEEIKAVIRILSAHGYRSMSNVVGEYIEKRIATAFEGEQAKHCQKGYDVFCRELGHVEVKSRNADAKSLQCTLPRKKLESLDHFILAIVREGEIEQVLLWNRDLLESLASASGTAYINRKHFRVAEDITDMFAAQPGRRGSA